MQIEIEEERRLAQIAPDAVERSEILDDGRIRRALAWCRRRRDAFAQHDMRGQGVLQRE
jgi:hypothetical protein